MLSTLQVEDLVHYIKASMNPIKDLLRLAQCDRNLAKNAKILPKFCDITY